MGGKDTIDLLTEYVKDARLVIHCLATGAIMKSIALSRNKQSLTGEEIGILHDIDYELVQGDLQRHGIEPERILLEHDIDHGTAVAVRQHNDCLHNTVYTCLVDIALQTAHSASGLIIACALVKGKKTF